MRRAVTAVVLTAAVVSLTATPAGAHTVTGVKPTNYASEILYVRPARPGVTVRVLDLGRRVMLRNTGAVDGERRFSNTPRGPTRR